MVVGSAVDLAVKAGSDSAEEISAVEKSVYIENISDTFIPGNRNVYKPVYLLVSNNSNDNQAEYQPEPKNFFHLPNPHNHHKNHKTVTKHVHPKVLQTGHVFLILYTFKGFLSMLPETSTCLK